MSNGRLIANNKKARHDFSIEETYEAGIVLKGTEVKSIRLGRVNLKDSYAEVVNGEIMLHKMHISPYEQGNINNVDPTRSRKLLLHKREIRKLIGYTTQKGYTLVPLKLYITEKGLVKILLATAEGKKLYDKRRTLAKKDSDRRIQRELADRQKM